MKKTTFILTAISIFLLGFAAGSGLCLLGKRGVSNDLCRNEVAKEIKDKLVKGGVVMPMSGQLSGTIKGIEGQDLIIEVNSTDPLLDQSLSIRRVKTDDRTSFSILTYKTPQERSSYAASSADDLASLEKQVSALNAEFENCLKGGLVDACQVVLAARSEAERKVAAIKNGAEGEYWRSEGGLEDLKVGFMVKVLADKGVDISEKREFQAVAVEAGAIPDKKE